MAMQNLSLASIIQESKSGENDAVRAFAPLTKDVQIPDAPKVPEKPKPVEKNDGVNAVKVIDNGVKAAEEEANRKAKEKSGILESTSNMEYLQTFLKVFGIA